MSLPFMIGALKRKVRMLKIEWRNRLDQSIRGKLRRFRKFLKYAWHDLVDRIKTLKTKIEIILEKLLISMNLYKNLFSTLCGESLLFLEPDFLK